MTESLHPSTHLDSASTSVDALPDVVLEFRQGAGRTSSFAMAHIDFLIGSVPGCDLRVPGSELPAVLCLLARRPGGLLLRKLAPTQMLLVNGQAVGQADLSNGDRITLGASDIFVRLTQASGKTVPPPAVKGSATIPAVATAHPAERDFSKKFAQFQDQVARFQAEREAFAAEQMQRRAELAESERMLLERELPPDLRQREEKLSLREAELQDQLADLQRQRQDLANVRQELADIRKQLYDRYQERRDRLAGLQESIERAAHKVQERKRQVDAEDQDLQQRCAELEKLTQRLEDDRRELEERRRQLEDRQRQLTQDQADLQAREHRLAADRLELEGMVKHFQADTLRLQRTEEDLQAREARLKARDHELEGRHARLEQESADLEQQTAQTEQWQARLTAEAEELARTRTEQTALAEHQAEREASIETQQTALASLKTRLDRQRDELKGLEQHLEEQRTRQAQAEAEIEKQFQECVRVRTELDADAKERDRERQDIIQRQTVLDAGEHQHRQAQERQAREEAELRQRQQDFDNRLAELADREADLLDRQAQLAASQGQLDSDRRSLDERAQKLAQAQQECQTLREQLRIRADELTAQQKAVKEQMQQHEADSAALKTRQEEWNQYHQETLNQLCAHKQHLEDRSAALDDESHQLEQQRTELQEREEAQRRQLDQLRETGQNIAEQRQRLTQDRERNQLEQQQARHEHEQARAEFIEMRLQVQSFVDQLPDLELQAGTTLERLAQAREQLRDHLNEINAYVRQCQDDMEKDGRQLHDKEKTLRQSQDDHRLALVTFRQQLIDWQGKVVQTTRSALGHVATAAAKPAPATEEPAASPRPTPRPNLAPTPRASSDVRDWYRKKMREASGIDHANPVRPRTPTTSAKSAKTSNVEDSEGDAPIIPIRRDILSLTDPADPSDRQLAELLRKLDLVEADVLQELLAESRRQRRPLRQVLLSGGTFTAYQLALIEAGNIDSLLLGPLRIIDRLRVSAQESVYHVFDPRRNQEAILRHLAEEQSRIAGRADEFRREFSQAILNEPHLAQTLEVLDIAGRPAVLQERLTGLTCPDWPALVAVPGVCFRLLIQAVQALESIHTAGLVHGHLHESLMLLTPDGVIKVGGLGEPAWLCDDEGVGRTRGVADDLQALGKIASKWCTPAGIRRGAKTKPPPDALVATVLGLAEGDSGHSSAGSLMNELEEIRKDIPANPEAWERLLRHVREHAAAVPLRQTA